MKDGDDARELREEDELFDDMNAGAELRSEREEDAELAR